MEVTKLPLAALMMHAGACSEALVWAGRKPLAEESLRDCPRDSGSGSGYGSGYGYGDGSGYGSAEVCQ